MKVLKTFWIAVFYDRREFHYKIESLQHQAKGFERFRLVAKNKTIVITSNRPLIRQQGLKHFPPTWIVEQGTISNPNFQEAIFKALETASNPGNTFSSFR